MNRDGKLTLAVLGLIVAGLCAAFVLLPDKSHSSAERRLLAQAPVLTAASLRSGGYARALERYLLDQFPGRELFRGANAVLRLDLLRQKDVGGLYRAGGALYKRPSAAQPAQASYAAARMNEIAARYLAGSKLYYAVIPDKGADSAARYGYPAPDDAWLLELLRRELDGMEYIDLSDCLTDEDYYRTDTHWRQERLDRVTARLSAALGIALPPWDSYTAHVLSPFSGVYQGQLALPFPSEELVYLTNARTESATVTVGETGEVLPVYDLARFAGPDGYDVFLSGTRAVLTVTCDGGEGELILFRDSFGGSLAPLLLGGYKTITLIDLRYLHGDLLADYVDFHGQDVLFLYSVGLLNSGMLLH